MWTNAVWILAILLTATRQISAKGDKCRPVFLLHGLLETKNIMETLEERIKKDYSGTTVFNSNAYPSLESAVALWSQIYGDLGQEFLDFCSKHPDGITVIGHSQGGLLLRAIIEVLCNDCVYTFISIASPHRGQFGIPAFYAPLVSLLQDPNLKEGLTYLFYLQSSQETFSVANYWNDPHRFQDYLEDNIFLPRINNEMHTEWNQSYKDCFLKIKKHVTIGGPKDAILIPWQSSQYEYFDEEENVVDYADSEIYKKDLFGLLTLDQSGRWIRYVKNGLDHFQFLFDEQVYEEAIKPYLGCTEKMEEG